MTPAQENPIPKPKQQNFDVLLICSLTNPFTIVNGIEAELVFPNSPIEYGNFDGGILSFLRKDSLITMFA